jgi:hypothetical protein
LPKNTIPRFVPIVTPAKEFKFRIFDLLTGTSFAETNNPELAETLARAFSKLYPRPSWIRRLFARATRTPLPAPTSNEIPPDLAAELEPEWRKRIRAINQLCDERKEDYRLAKGGRLFDPEPDNHSNLKRKDRTNA